MRCQSETLMMKAFEANRFKSENRLHLHCVKRQAEETYMQPSSRVWRRTGTHSPCPSSCTTHWQHGEGRARLGEGPQESLYFCLDLGYGRRMLQKCPAYK
ncbi:hypothetical protein M3J09_007382 [Ascochyta lentis]